MKHYLFGAASAFALALAACGSADEATTDAAASAADAAAVETAGADSGSAAQSTQQAAVQLGSWGFDTTTLDTSVDPGDDFYRYANGGWLDRTEIPADRARYGAFSVLADRAEARVRDIIETSASKDSPSADERRIGDLYAAYTDVDAIEARGLEPVENELARIRAADTHAAIASLMADPALGLAAPFSPFVYIDAKDNDNYITYLSQGGLGLPNRDYYFDASENGQRILAAYRDYLATMLSEAGFDDAESRAQAVLDFETALAEGHWSRVEQRDRDRTYNKMDRDAVLQLTDGFPTAAMLDQLGLGGETQFVVREPSALENAAQVFADTDPEVLQAYLAASLLGSHADYLPARIDQARFDFYGRTLRGQEEQRPRWKRGVAEVNGTLGELVGKVYVAEHFPESSKAQMLELIENLRASYREGIDNLEWMDADTKEAAQYKLAQFNPKIGYPDVWEPYQGLEVMRDDLVGTAQSARAWAWQDNVSQLGQPIDRDEWGMTPQTVNAYYNPSLNEIVFPAAILDAPFFDPAADPAVNYGGIGAVIGHEMGHGFDDQGRKSDGDGVQRDWWSEADAERYMGLADALAEQYSSYEPLPGENLDGRLGLGENIGDLTGITMAYDAYKKSLNGQEAPVIDGLTGDQRFFLGWAQVWQNLYREDALRAQIKNGPHSPPRYRVNGSVRNFGPWYEAFGVEPGDALYLAPEERVKIW